MHNYSYRYFYSVVWIISLLKSENPNQSAIRIARLARKTPGVSRPAVGDIYSSGFCPVPLALSLTPRSSCCQSFCSNPPWADTIPQLKFLVKTFVKFIPWPKDRRPKKQQKIGAFTPAAILSMRVGWMDSFWQTTKALRLGN